MSITTLIGIGVFIISLAGLVKGSDMFSDFAERLAYHFKIPPFIIGVTIVSIGTSLPELFSAISANLHGATEIALGDIIGSNITNIFLVLGVATLFMKTTKLKVTHELIHVDLPFFVGSVFMIVLALWDNKFSQIEGLIAICGALLYILYTISVRKDMKNARILEEINIEHKTKKFSFLDIPKGGVGLLLLLIGAKYFIESIIITSAGFSISTELIAITLVPLGSNLPELSVTIRNAIRGKSEIVVGNILGSNIFNLFGVLGIAGLLGTLTASPDFFQLAIPTLIASTLLYFFITQEKEITRWEGGLLLLSYVMYINLAFNFLS
ncbi:MAG: calcium/sodium antiporter [Patescibacteria group bacterium]|nr:calcium/sodium antiporter [Patescibacteria group bacterium]